MERKIETKFWIGDVIYFVESEFKFGCKNYYAKKGKVKEVTYHTDGKDTKVKYNITNTQTVYYGNKLFSTAEEAITDAIGSSKYNYEHFYLSKEDYKIKKEYKPEAKEFNPTDKEEKEIEYECCKESSISVEEDNRIEED